MTANAFGLIESPLVGGLLLGKHHVFRGIAAAQRSDCEYDRVDRREKRHATRKILVLPFLQFFGIRQFDGSHGASSPVRRSPVISLQSLRPTVLWVFLSIAR